MRTPAWLIKEKIMNKVEGGNLPQLRFSEFQKNWIEVRLGGISEFLKGKGISKSDVDVNGQLKCIRYGELYTHYNEVMAL